MVESEPSVSVCIGGLYRFHDDWANVWYEVPVAVDLAAAIRRLDDAMLKREKRHQQRQITFTDLQGRKTRAEPVAPDGVESQILDGHRLPRLAPPGSEWEGPRLLFTLLLGLNRIWAGPPGVGPCPDCGGRQLSGYVYCLTCDKCGLETRIPPPTRADLARKRMLKPKADGLAGGVGARPRGRGRTKPVRASAKA